MAGQTSERNQLCREVETLFASFPFPRPGAVGLVNINPLDAVEGIALEDRAAFLVELRQIIENAVSLHLGSIRSPQGFIIEDFDQFPVLSRYVRQVHICGETDVGLTEDRWITCTPTGGPIPDFQFVICALEWQSVSPFRDRTE